MTAYGSVNMPDEIDLPQPAIGIAQPESAAPEPPPAAEASAEPIVMAEVPTEVPAEPVTMAEVQAEPTVPAEPSAPAAKPRRSPPKPRISDDTLAEWQATMAAANARKQRAQRQAAAARERSEGFRALRAALRRLDEAEPQVDDALAADRLAVAVHEAPEHVRSVIAATLRLLTRPRRRR